MTVKQFSPSTHVMSICIRRSWGNDEPFPSKQIRKAVTIARHLSFWTSQLHAWTLRPASILARASLNRAWIKTSRRVKVHTDRKRVHKPFTGSSCDVELVGCLLYYANKRIALIFIDDVPVWYLEEDSAFRSSQPWVEDKNRDANHSQANFLHQSLGVPQ